MKDMQIEQRLQNFLNRRLNQKGTINAMMDMECISYHIAEKKVILAFSVSRWQLNPAMNMHGGMICTALDMTMGCAAYIFGNAQFTPTIQMSVNFVSAIHEGDVVFIEGICDHCGSRMTQTRAIAYIQPDQHMVATANGSYAMNNKY